MQSFAKTSPARAIFSIAALAAAALTSQVANAAPAADTPSADAVRSAIRFETVRWGGKPVRTLDEASRILLAKAAAEKAGLREVGLSYHDVYGVIEAETSWIQRAGASKDGTPNLGLAQFEPRTAQGMGLKDPGDPVQAVFAAAKYMKMGAQWARGKIAHLKSDPQLYAAKLREGVSVHYNLSIKGRNKWNGLNTAELPVETQRHIRNASSGAKEAAALARKFKV
jgi:soluble lytic murein transglycosylase-like protein